MGHAERCVSCGARLSGRYCSACGERVLDEHDFSFSHFAEETTDSLFHLDGKVLGGVWLLLTRPGELTSHFLAGRRTRYVRPIQIFVLANVFYFLMQPLSGFTPFTTPLDVHLGGGGVIVWSGLARHLVDARLAQRHITLDQYEEAFDHVAHAQGKTLIILMVPAFAVAVWMLYRRERPYYVQHVMFALHVYAFLLVWTAVETLLAKWGVQLVRRGGYSISPDTIDIVSSLVLLLPFAAYVYAASRRVFHESRAATSVKTVGLIAWLVVVLAAYRFVLFLTTFVST